MPIILGNTNPTFNTETHKPANSDSSKNAWYFRICGLNEIPMIVPNYQAMVAVSKRFFDKHHYLSDTDHPKIENTMLKLFGWGAELTESFFEVDMTTYNETEFINKMASAGYTMIKNPNLPV